MAKKAIAASAVVWVLCLIQFIPFVLFPLKSFSPKSQEWWLPVLCALMALLGTLQLMVRRSQLLWPWYILSFAHGVNIISRLMLFLPKATVNVKGTQKINGLYILLSVLSILISAFYLWYFEQHEVRVTFLLKKGEAKAAA